VEKYCRAGQTTYENSAFALNAGYQRLQTHTFGLCNAYCFSSAAIVVQTPLNVTLYVYCLSCWKSVASFHKNVLRIVLF